MYMHFVSHAHSMFGIDINCPFITEVVGSLVTRSQAHRPERPWTWDKDAEKTPVSRRTFACNIAYFVSCKYPVFADETCLQERRWHAAVGYKYQALFLRREREISFRFSDCLTCVVVPLCVSLFLFFFIFSCSSLLLDCVLPLYLFITKTPYYSQVVVWVHS